MKDEIMTTCRSCRVLLVDTQITDVNYEKIKGCPQCCLYRCSVCGGAFRERYPDAEPTETELEHNFPSNVYECKDCGRVVLSGASDLTLKDYLLYGEKLHKLTSVTVSSDTTYYTVTDRSTPSGGS